MKPIESLIIFVIVLGLFFTPIAVAKTYNFTSEKAHNCYESIRLNDGFFKALKGCGGIE